MEATTQTSKPRGRPCSFDRDDVVEKVMQLFWERGYHNTSFNEIANAIGLTRASLYNSFESKDALFLETIQRYVSTAPDKALDLVKEGDPVGPAFYETFTTACKDRAEDDKHRGCLVVNCLAELSTTDSELGKKLAGMVAERRAYICNLVKQAIRQGELPNDTNPETTANMVITFMAGFSTFCKFGADEASMLDLCHTFLKQIGFKPA